MKSKSTKQKIDHRFKLSKNDITKSDLKNLEYLLHSLDKEKTLANIENIRNISYWKDIMNSGFQISIRDSSKENRVVAIATVTMNKCPFGKFFDVRNVVVDPKLQGLGIGKILVQYIFEITSEHSNNEGTSLIELISSDSYEFWNKVGFTEYKTKLFRKNI